MVMLLASRPTRRATLAAAFVLASLLLTTTGVIAAPVGPGRAAEAVRAWLAMETAPLRTQLGARIGEVRTYPDEHGGTAYYVVSLAPGGFVIAAADDLIEPIICFSPGGSYDPSPGNPLGALVTSDMQSRMGAIKGGGEILRSAQDDKNGAQDDWSAAQDDGYGAQDDGRAGARGKWARLTRAARSAGRMAAGVQGPLSDERVPPLTETEWSQETAFGAACYNYFTPPNAMGTASNYPSGCVATAMAQLMRYHQYPTAGVGNKSFTIEVDGSTQSRALRGGDGVGGAYDYANMALSPGFSTTQTQREAIGALCHDAGVSVGTSYTPSGSSATLSDASTQLTGTFHYANAIFGYNSGAEIGAGLIGMINPNLDAGLPVLLGINGPVYGHATICDGYGYDLGTPYHHLNLGWSGTDNAWYNLPDVNASQGTFATVDQCVLVKRSRRRWHVCRHDCLERHGHRAGSRRGCDHCHGD